MLIKHISTKKVVIVDFEDIPFNRLFLEESLQQINAIFNFKGAEIINKKENQPMFLYTMGTITDDDSRELITKIEIERRKIVIEVEGDSAFSDKVYKRLHDVLLVIKGAPQEKLVPFIQSYESLIIAEMNISADDLLEPRLLSFIRGPLLDQTDSELANPTMNHYSLRFRLDYFLTDEKMKEYKITISPKTFSIGPREGTLLEEQIFLSEAPLNTETHKTILERIEEIYS